jgi:hypothetical protein
MRKLAFVFIFIVTVNSQAQLFVSNNSYVFNNNSLVYVTNDVDLNGANSNFYLRNEGQLLQGGTTVGGVNKGVGKLSVFQEGTVNNFAYNYWCSPVGNATASTTGNENFGITMLNVPTTNIASTPANMTTSYNGVSSAGSLTIASYWIWKFLSSSTYSQWFQSAANIDIAAGQGFTMKGTSGSDATNVGETVVNNPGSAQRYDFRGKPNDGDITVNVGIDKFTLTGNPYPSALHVNAFLLDPSNSDCTGIAYYWEHDKTVNSHLLLAYRGGYGTYAPLTANLTDYGVYVPATFNSYNIDGTVNVVGASSGLVIQRKYAPIGQGFMVKGKASGTPVAVTLKNSHRSYYKESDTYSQFERTSFSQSQNDNEEPIINPVSVIRLNTKMNNQFTKQIALVLMPSATDGIDRGIDALSPVEESVPNDIYFVLNQDKYVIQGVSFDVNKRIQVGIKATEMSSFEFDASMISNFDESQNIFLYDDFDGSYHDIKNNSFQITLPPGIYNNRFEITFKNSSLNINDDIKSNLVITQNNTNQIFTVHNPNLLEIKSVKLFDLTGKQIFDKQRLGVQNNYQFSTSGLASSVYLVEISTTDNRKMVQKIIVSSN